MDEKKCIELGKKDAKMFIANERIDYTPFVAMSDMHMVRRAMKVNYDSLKKTLEKTAPDLWQEVDNSASQLKKKNNITFSFDEYAQGFVEGVAAVLEQIKDKI